MPKVGKMKFPYTKRGVEEAVSYAKQSGKQLEVEGYRGGGMVPKYQRGGMIPRRPGMGPRRAGMRPGMRPGTPRPSMGRQGLGGMRPRAGGPRFQKGGKVSSIGDIMQRLASLTGYKKGGKVKK